MRFLILGLMTLAILACNKQEDTAKAASTTEAKSVVVNAAMLAKLVEADKVDGVEDHIVSKCGGCALGMDGSTEQTFAVGDYKMHFCSDFCKKAFENEPETRIANLVIPQI